MSSGNIRFECAFSEKAIKSNTRAIIYPMIFYCVFVVLMGSWLLLAILIIFTTLIYSINVWSYNKLVNESYIEISEDGILYCKYNGHKAISYPISEIQSIKEGTLNDNKYAVFPVVLNLYGDELYPPTGVLITFNRAWIKSVFPVYVNPLDIEGFISSIRQRIKPVE